MTLRNWAGNVTFSTDVLHRPTTVEQVQELVAATPRLRVLGSGHSFNRIADTTGELVSVRDLVGAVEVSGEGVSFPAGRLYGEVVPALEAHGRALHNLGSLPHISVAGACATGTHGSGDGNAVLASAVRAIEFVDGRGELVRLADGDADFGGAVLALGALGVVTRVVLATEPTYTVRQDVWLDLPVDRYVHDLDEIMAAGHSVSAFTTWQRPEILGTVWVKSRSESSSAAEPERWGGRLADAAQHPIPGEDAAAATPQLGVPGPWHTRLPHFRLEFTPSSGDEVQSEWFVPRAHAAAAVVALQSVSARIAPHLMVCELRTIAADSLWLSHMRDGARFALHFTWRPDVGRDTLAVVEKAFAGLDARAHWGKVFVQPPTSERLPEFRELIDRYDPQRRFANDYLERYVY